VNDWRPQCLTVGPLQMNAWLLCAGREAALVDPGDEGERLCEAVADSGRRLRYLLATHGHFDHVGAAAAVQERWDLPLRCHPEDAALVGQMAAQQALFGFPASTAPRLQADLVDGLVLPLGDGELRVVHVPGHSPGQIMLVWPGHALVGDTVFAGSVGRTDLPGGSSRQLTQSIRERVYALPDATILHPGHGPETTVGREKATNPFVRG